MQRVAGVGRLSFQAASGVTRVRELYQEGAFRLRLPGVGPGAEPEAVTINTAGGLTGGDRLTFDLTLEPGAHALVTSQACEKIYRALDDEARISATVTLGAGSSLDWLAQPMIVFDRARVRRSFEVEMAEDARLLAVDGIILGRAAMGERVASGTIHDGWRISRGGRLVLADAFRAGPDVAATLTHPAVLGPACALATVVYVAADAGARLAEARALAASLNGEAAASAWNGGLVVRLLNKTGQGLTSDLVRFVTGFRGRAMPRGWSC